MISGASVCCCAAAAGHAVRPALCCRTNVSTRPFARRSNAAAPARSRSSSAPGPASARRCESRLSSQGRRITGEFPALDAIAAEVPAATTSTTLVRSGNAVSVSDNATVGGHQLLSNLEQFHVRTVDRGPRRAAASVAAAVDAGRAPVALSSLLQCSTPQRRRCRSSTRASSRASTSAAASPPFTISRTATFARRRLPTQYGHGTHVAGLAAGTYVGVAPTARLIGLKVLDAQGQGTTDNVIRAIEFAIVNKEVLQHRHPQPLARPSHLRAGGDGPAGAGG